MTDRQITAVGEDTMTRDVTPDGDVLVRVWDKDMRYLGTYEEVFSG